MSPPPPSAPSSTDPAPTVVWLRDDLRRNDHPALRAAADRGGPVVPVVVHDPGPGDDPPPGAASDWWRHHSLAALADDFERAGSPLVLRDARGDGDADGADVEPAAAELLAVCRRTGADRVHWNRTLEPGAAARDRRVRDALEREGVQVRDFRADVLWATESVRTGAGDPYRVFTPFWNACLDGDDPAEPVARVDRLTPPDRAPASVALDDLDLLPPAEEGDWPDGPADAWTPGEESGRRRMHAWLRDGIAEYHETRDLPARAGTSRLSPHLHFGEVSVRELWHAVRESAGDGEGPRTFLRELGWREFARHLLHHFPDTISEPLQRKFTRLRWRDDADGLRAWRRGRTGFDLVDAGMRELWATGWMHNRVRMVVGSFLVKDLLVDWREGEAWFRDTLVDWDLANNTLGWQWVAGCGADAAPFFRVFNPDRQAERWDPDRTYRGRWAPDPLAKILDHKQARARALAAFERVKGAE